MTLEFSPRARLDLVEILNCIARDKPQSAIRFVNELEKRCRLLAKFPHLGTSRDDLMPALRVFSYRGYGIYFRVLEETVRVERVIGPGLYISEDQF